jgi:hypothetical protein
MQIQQQKVAEDASHTKKERYKAGSMSYKKVWRKGGEKINAISITIADKPYCSKMH